MVRVMFGPPGRPLSHPAAIEPIPKTSMPDPRSRILSDPPARYVRNAIPAIKRGMIPRKTVFMSGRSSGGSKIVSSLMRTSSTRMIKKDGRVRRAAYRNRPGFMGIHPPPGLSSTGTGYRPGSFLMQYRR
jgi:hypothetical protein